MCISAVHHDGQLFHLTIYSLHPNGELAEVQSAQSTTFAQTHWQLTQTTSISFESEQLIPQQQPHKQSGQLI